MGSRSDACDCALRNLLQHRKCFGMAFDGAAEQSRKCHRPIADDLTQVVKRLAFKAQDDVEDVSKSKSQS
jgi:hypothetical protein